jgi:aryl-alcohol dehydrogenase-like predicted oxidoreductase
MSEVGGKAEIARRDDEDRSSILSGVAARLEATPMQVALAWLLRRAPNILLIPGTSSVAHLRENFASVELNLSDDAVTALNRIGDSIPQGDQSVQQYEAERRSKGERHDAHHEVR